MQGQQIPLTPPPANLSMASASSPWSVIWRMLGIVILIFLIANVSFLIVLGIFENNSLITLFSTICMAPLLIIFMLARRPKLSHVLLATPSQEGSKQHMIAHNRVLSTPVPTFFSHHLIKDSHPLEMPKASTLWLVFSLTVIGSFGGLLPVLFSDDPIWLILALLVGVPAWLFGFSLPVHAWWSFSTRHLEMSTTKRDGEAMLVAGMLSTIPALIINSLLFPLMLVSIGIESMEPGTIGELMILAISAPVGEELCKAALVLSLYRIIDSPRRGFQVGFSVGLGFALLENLQYILGSLLYLEGAALSYTFTVILRGIGSIPGHAFWTGLSGTAIGWYLCRNRGVSQIKPPSESSNWVVFDSTSGEIVQEHQPISELSYKIKLWLHRPADKVWKLPMVPTVGILLAIAGHSFWNGSMWFVSKLVEGQGVVIEILVSLGWIFLLICGLWYIGRQILAAVMHLPAR